MTAGAIYSYFATRDDLITTLVGDVYTVAVDAAESARDAVPATDPGGRILAWAQAMRDWALSNPEGFRLIYGDPVPGYRPPGDGPGKVAGLRACTGLVGLAAAAWPTAENVRWATESTPGPTSTRAWSPCPSGLSGPIAGRHRAGPAGVGPHARADSPGDLRPPASVHPRSGDRLPRRDARPHQIPGPGLLILAQRPSTSTSTAISSRSDDDGAAAGIHTLGE
jgi:hypothetical protein